MTRVKSHTWAKAGLVVALSALASNASTAMQAADEAQPARRPTPVRVANVESASLAPRRLVTGELRSPRTSRVAAREPGIVEDILVRDGQRVRKGDTLATIDSEPLDQEIAAVESQIAAARALVAQRAAEVAWYERDLAMVRDTVERGAGNNRELVEAEAKVAAAAPQVTQAERQVDALLAQRAQLDRRRRDLTVVAPFAGTVVRRETEAGQWLAEGNVVAEIVETAALEARFSVPQALYPADGKPRAGIELEVDALRRPLPLTAIRIVPMADSRARTFEAIVDVENADGSLIPGMSVTAFVPDGDASDVVLVPKDAILRGETGPFVFAVRDGMAMPVNVRTLFPVGTRYAVTPGGLAAGDSVVVEGNERLFPMSPVEPVAGGKGGDAAATTKREGSTS